MLAWGFSFQETCGKDINAYAFARVHLATAKASLVAKDAIVHFNPSMGAFSHDNRHFATSSGNAQGAGMQLLVFEAATGAVVLNSDLKGLTRALGVSDDAPFAAVWGIAHMPPPPA